MNEAIVTVNGVQLSIGQVMTLRVALGNFGEQMRTTGLGSDVQGKAMAEAYATRASEVELLLIGGIQNA